MKVLNLPWVLFLLHCGLFYRGVPKAGEFCDVLVKPMQCLSVDFENRLLTYEERYYPLRLRTRTEFLFDYHDLGGELWVMTENRVEIRFPGSNMPTRFYLRKKNKSSK